MCHCVAKGDPMSDLQRIDAILFDLDGTLIDSAPSILACFSSVLREADITPLVSLDSSLIGPPLRKTLQIMSGIEEAVELDHLAERFKDIYDTCGYRETVVYDGIEELLAMLHHNRIALAIATNKRRAPTLKILKYLGWEQYFSSVGSLDTSTPAHPDKAALIASMLSELNLIPSATLYVGDKYDDGVAAEANGLQFAAAAWGYGKWNDAGMPDGWQLIREPAHLTGMRV